MKESNRDQAVYRELGIRAVIRAINQGKSVAGFHPSTVRAARRRLADTMPPEVLDKIVDRIWMNLAQPKPWGIFG